MSEVTLADRLDKMCTNKLALTKEQADASIDRYARRKEVMYYYQCILCSMYHVTSLEPFKKEDYKFEIIGGESTKEKK